MGTNLSGEGLMGANGTAWGRSAYGSKFQRYSLDEISLIALLSSLVLGDRWSRHHLKMSVEDGGGWVKVI